MQNLVPRHIQETESDRRAIKDGWYATNETGQVCSGRFSNRADCQAQIKRGETNIASVTEPANEQFYTDTRQ
jgi:hypothetical protein